jgi:hypothetical protein
MMSDDPMVTGSLVFHKVALKTNTSLLYIHIKQPQAIITDDITVTNYGNT